MDLFLPFPPWHAPLTRQVDIFQLIFWSDLCFNLIEMLISVVFAGDSGQTPPGNISQAVSQWGPELPTCSAQCLGSRSKATTCSLLSSPCSLLPTLCSLLPTHLAALSWAMNPVCLRCGQDHHYWWRCEAPHRCDSWTVVWGSHLLPGAAPADMWHDCDGMSWQSADAVTALGDVTVLTLHWLAVIDESDGDLSWPSADSSSVQLNLWYYLDASS